MANGMTRLYGRTGTVVAQGGREYRCVNGVVDVPDVLVATCLNAGFSRRAPVSLEDDADVAILTEHEPVLAGVGAADAPKKNGKK